MDDFVPGMFFGASIATVIIVAAILLAGPPSRRVQVEAVERGYAEWVADNEGNTTFKWKGDDEQD